MRILAKYAAVILCNCAALSTIAIAGQASADQRDATLVAFGDWAVRCQYLPGALPCDIVHQVSHRDSQKRILGFSIVYSPETDKYAVQIIIPLGVNLRRGIDLVVGDVSAQNVRITRCELSGCFIEALLAADMVEAFAKNDRGSITFSGGEENDATIEFSLKGFSAAQRALKTELATPARFESE